jgi:hypothetical protein
MESQLQHTMDTIGQKRRTMEGLRQEIEAQEAAGRTPPRSFFGRVLAAVGGGPQDPRLVLEKVEAEVAGLERLRQALHAGEGGKGVVGSVGRRRSRGVPAQALWRCVCSEFSPPPPAAFCPLQTFWT